MMPVLDDLGARVQRRLPLCLAIFVAGVLGGVLTAFIWPPEYRAETRLLLTPDATRAGDVDPAERLETFEARLLTRESLAGIARAAGLAEPGLSEVEIAAAMRGALDVQIRSGRARAKVIAITVRASDGAAAAAAAAAAADRLLAIARGARAEGDAGAAARRETEALAAALAQVRARIEAERRAAWQDLPEALGPTLRERAEIAARRRTLEAERMTLVAERDALIARHRETGRVPDETLASEGATLALRDSRDALAGLRSLYSERHPSVRAAMARVAALEAAFADATAGAVPQTPGTGDALLTAALAPIDARLTAFGHEADALDEAASAADARLSRIAATGARLEALGDERDALRRRHDAAAAAVAEVDGQTDLVVIEPPAVPLAPETPDRPLIAVAGLVLGAAAAVAVGVVLDRTDRRVHGPADLGRALGIAPFAALPYLAEGPRRRRPLRIAALAGGATVAGIGAAWG